MPKSSSTSSEFLRVLPADHAHALALFQMNVWCVRASASAPELPAECTRCRARRAPRAKKGANTRADDAKLVLSFPVAWRHRQLCSSPDLAACGSLPVSPQRVAPVGSHVPCVTSVIGISTAPLKHVAAVPGAVNFPYRWRPHATTDDTPLAVRIWRCFFPRSLLQEHPR